MRLHNIFAASQVSVDKERALASHLLKENMQRCKLFAYIVILFECILILMNLSLVISNKTEMPVLNFYLLMYVLLIAVSLWMVRFIRRFENRTSLTDKEYKKFEAGLLAFVMFFILWGAAITLADQQGYGNIMAFAVNFMCVSILFHASNKVILQLYSLPVAVLLIGLPFFQPSSAILTGHYINLTVFLFFCWLASRMLYHSNSVNFYTKLLLTETNKSLAQKIEENEKVNRKLKDVNGQLQQLALIDELTAIPNRRGFQRYIEEELQEPGTRKLSLMMFDIDAFKLFNDNYGHLEGDRIIQAVANRLQDTLDPAVGFISRFGGEEFVIAMFDKSAARAARLAETVRLTVEEMKIPHRYSPVTDYVTISIGVATAYVNDEAAVIKLLESADAALYKAKSFGRNRVDVHVEETNHFFAVNQTNSIETS